MELWNAFKILLGYPDFNDTVVSIVLLSVFSFWATVPIVLVFVLLDISPPLGLCYLGGVVLYQGTYTLKIQPLGLCYLGGVVLTVAVMFWLERKELFNNKD